MIDKTYQKFAIVTSDTAKGFETELNKKMEELGQWNPEVEFNMNQGHCAYIRYEERILVPESVKDEYRLQGIKYVCGECPFFQLSEDKRIKYSVCGEGMKVYYDREACEELYEKIKKGEVEL